jgi:hypothetical protein
MMQLSEVPTLAKFAAGCHWRRMTVGAQGTTAPAATKLRTASILLPGHVAGCGSRPGLRCWFCGRRNRPDFHPSNLQTDPTDI